MKFSIIIPVYNVEKFLEKCLQSVLNQTFNDYEVICINDGSTDNSLQILREYEQKFANLVIIDSKNSGTAAARNLGLQHARSEYIWFVDSDDWVVENALKVFDNQLRNAKPDVLSFNGKLIYESNLHEEFDEIAAENFTSGWAYYNKYALQTRKFHFVCVVLRLYRRDFLIENQLFFDKTVSFEDNLFIPQVFYLAENVKVISEKLYFYRIREGSKMTTLTKKRVFDIVNVANKLAEFFIPKDIDKSVIYREIAGMYFSIFMPPKNIVPSKELKKVINWHFYKTVSQHRRHKIIYNCLKFSTFTFHLFFKMEKIIKRKIL